MTRLFSARRGILFRSSRCRHNARRDDTLARREQKSYKSSSSGATRSLRVHLHSSRIYIYRSLQPRDVAISSYFSHFTRRTVSYGHFTWATSCIKLMNIADRSERTEVRLFAHFLVTRLSPTPSWRIYISAWRRESHNCTNNAPPKIWLHMLKILILLHTK